MIRLVDFIKNVEDEVFEKVQYFTRNQDKIDSSSRIWVHRLKGKVRFDEAPSKPGFAWQPCYHLCCLDNDLRWTPDKKAIKKWIEEEVLMYAS